MHKIDLQTKAKPLTGTIGYYAFEDYDGKSGFTYFHYVSVPLYPFETGIEGDNYPVKTEIMIEWMNFEVEYPEKLDGVEGSFVGHSQSQGTIAIHNVYHACEVRKISFKHLEENHYKVKGELLVKFEEKGIAANEVFEFDIEAALILGR